MYVPVHYYSFKWWFAISISKFKANDCNLVLFFYFYYQKRFCTLYVKWNQILYVLKNIVSLKDVIEFHISKKNHIYEATSCFLRFLRVVRSQISKIILSLFFVTKLVLNPLLNIKVHFFISIYLQKDLMISIIGFYHIINKLRLLRMYKINNLINSQWLLISGTSFC
jgi:hypothetical protein